jgi:hypothetical protein
LNSINDHHSTYHTFKLRINLIYLSLLLIISGSIIGQNHYITINGQASYLDLSS